MKFRVSFFLDADSVDDAADEVAAILNRAEVAPGVVYDVVTHDAPTRVLHFAERTPS